MFSGWRNPFKKRSFLLRLCWWRLGTGGGVFIALTLSLWAGTRFFHHQMSLEPTLQKMKSYLIPPPPLIERFTFGQDLFISDILWLKSIQQSDECENKEKEKKSSFAGGEEKEGDPGRSWLFKMLDAITRLDPLYRVVYSLGGVALSVLCEDKEGARLLFHRGIKHFPGDWSLYFKAAYHELYEMKNRTQAAHLFWEAGRLGAPQWVFLLAHRLFLKEGQKAVLGPLLYQVLKEGHQGPIVEKIKRKILQAELEKAQKDID